MHVVLANDDDKDGYDCENGNSDLTAISVQKQKSRETSV